MPDVPMTRSNAVTAPGFLARLSIAYPAAVLSLVAGWVHIAYWQSHWQEWWAAGLFFLVAGLGQGLFAVAIVRWARPALALAGLSANLVIVATYVLSRTAGVPVGPHAEVVERAGAVDLATTAIEILLVGVLVAMVGRATRRAIVNAMLVLGMLLWGLRLTGNLP